MIPETLAGWNLEVVRALVEQAVFETDRFDFKEVLPHSKDEKGKSRLRRDVAAFANSGGGFLVLGVKDDKGLAVEERLAGVPADLDFPEHFGNYPAASEPSLSGAWSFKNPPIALSNGRVVHVVHVPSSPRKPHGVFEEQRWWFCKRTNKGTEVLSYQEIRGLFVDAEQLRANLAFFRSELQRVFELAQRQQDASGRAIDQFVGVRYNTSRIEGVYPLVFAVLSERSSWLVRHVDVLRNAAQEADAWLSQVSPLVRLDSYQATALRQKVGADAGRIIEAAKSAMAVFDKVLP